MTTTPGPRVQFHSRPSVQLPAALGNVPVNETIEVFAIPLATYRAAQEQVDYIAGACGTDTPRLTRRAWHQAAYLPASMLGDKPWMAVTTWREVLDTDDHPLIEMRLYTEPLTQQQARDLITGSPALGCNPQHTASAADMERFE